MIITAIKAAAFIAFFGITVGLLHSGSDQYVEGHEQDTHTQPMCPDHQEGALQEHISSV